MFVGIVNKCFPQKDPFNIHNFLYIHTSVKESQESPLHYAELYFVILQRIEQTLMVGSYSNMNTYVCSSTPLIIFFLDMD